MQHNDDKTEPQIAQQSWDEGDYCAVVHEGQELEAKIFGLDKTDGTVIVILLEKGQLLEVLVEQLVASRGHLSRVRARFRARARRLAAAVAAAADTSESEEPLLDS